jgi:choline dehydrogenase-like flavoprotein
LIRANRHVGTIWVGKHPADGVVNADARVHGIDALCIAGSSIFPTGGGANPTLTIAAMTYRLSDTVRRRPSVGTTTVNPSDT